MRPTPTPTLIRAPAPEPRGRRPASPTLVHAALDDQTLLALILERLDPETDPARLAAALLERFGSLGGVAGAAPGELAQASSTGPALRAELTLLREFAVRLARAEACRRPVITSWTALVAYVRAALAHEPREQFRTLFLDRRNILLRDEMTADGTVDHAPVYVATVVDCYLALTAGQGVTHSRQCRPCGAGR
ncbi:JAB domain-containing protein [Brevundimonas sp.]|uniref:JAB domain-containing protein n=1 Tax=Brevundimonas sp. TaxID=1871086 RepID=UPI003F70B5A1